ncbi:MAG: YceI family protein [Parafilimonas sp.]
MKLILGFIFLISGLVSVNAQLYKTVDEKSKISFTIKNFGFNTPGSLTGLKGTIKFNPSDLPSSSFNVSVDVNTINTGIDARDNHLKKEEYFDVDKFPTINFVSTNITKDQNGFTVSGNFTIKGVTKPISFPFTAQNQDNGLLLDGSFIINRKDFGVGGSSAVLSNTANINLKVFAIKN